MSPTALQLPVAVTTQRHRNRGQKLENPVGVEEEIATGHGWQDSPYTPQVGILLHEATIDSYSWSTLEIAHETENLTTFSRKSQRNGVLGSPSNYW